MAPGALSPAPPSPGGSSHGGRRPPRGRPCSTWGQAGWAPAAGGLPEAGWQVVLVTHGGKTPPPPQAEAKHSSGYQVVSSLLLCKPAPPRCSCPQHRRSFIPRRPPAQVLSSAHPQLGLCPLQPLSSCHRAVSPRSNHPSLPEPLQGTIPPQEGSRSLPSFTPWWSYRAREALPSEDGHFLAQIPRYRPLGYHLRGQSCLNCQFYLAPQWRSAGLTVNSCQRKG